jgi:hypothetical protein
VHIPFHQPLIPVVLRALVGHHPVFGNVGYKNPPTGDQSELGDRLFIAMHRQGKVSNIHHFKGGFRVRASSADILFMRP